MSPRTLSHRSPSGAISIVRIVGSPAAPASLGLNRQQGDFHVQDPSVSPRGGRRGCTDLRRLQAEIICLSRSAVIAAPADRVFALVNEAGLASLKALAEKAPK